MTVHEPITMHMLTTIENSSAFIRLKKLCHPAIIIDETEELDSWRQEKFIHESTNRY